jgi:DNA-binding CsgD family transcriptional regulator
VPLALEKRVLSLVGELLGLLDLDDLSRAMLHELRSAVPADWCALNEVPGDREAAISLTDPPLPARFHEAFARFGHQNPIAAHFAHTRDGRALRFSDLLTRRDLHRLELYQKVYKPLKVEYQIAFTLPSTSGPLLGAALSRSQRDFTARERDMLNLARPYLIQIYRNALAHAHAQRRPRPSLQALQALGLTRRQAEILQLITNGHTPKTAAAALGITPKTAHKHLEHCYRTLGVTSHTQAARLAANQTRRQSDPPEQFAAPVGAVLNRAPLEASGQHLKPREEAESVPTAAPSRTPPRR